MTIISETKKKGNGLEEAGDFIHMWSGVKKDQRARVGVGILIRKKYKKNIKSWDPINKIIIKLHLKIYGRNLVILGAYGPTDDSPVPEKENFMEALHEEVLKIKHKEEVIIAGDLNGRVGKKKNDNTIGQFGEDVMNDNGERIV